MTRLSPLLGAVLAALIFATPAEPHGSRPHETESTGPADGYVFALPEPGSYRLPPIRKAAGGGVLDETGRAHDLGDLIGGRIAVLAFIYTQCAEICPIATMRLLQLHEMVGRDPALARRLRLISMSFDPEQDTPDVMHEHAELWRGPASATPEWLFLTAPDAASLKPILHAYDQTVGRRPRAEHAAGTLNHVLRVFLIDDVGMIRNIYSLDFLDPRLLLNDIRTLLIERDRGS